MLSEKELEELSDRFIEAFERKEEIQEEINRLRIFLKEHWPEDLERFKTKKGCFKKMNNFSKWIFPESIYEILNKAKEDGTAKKVSHEIITFYRAKLKPEPYDQT